jgi:hypothetical protein
MYIADPKQEGIPMKRFSAFLVAGIGLAFTLSVLIPASTPMPAWAADSDDDADSEEPIWIQGSRTVINLILEGDFKTACMYLDERVSEYVTPKSLSNSWDDWIEQAGEFQSLGEATMTVKDSLHIVRIEGNFQWKKGIFVVAWNEEGAVAGFGLKPAPKEEKPEKETEKEPKREPERDSEKGTEKGTERDSEGASETSEPSP